MRAKELREKNTGELNNFLNEERSKLNQLRFGAKSNQLKDYKEMAKIRKNIARTLTILRENNLNNK
ncbi:MAG: 50S ribosomal protein L29 [Candidatus Moranbacteria bacterium]|jgi:large subunit ribosomal protein L29|nr:50S ribosomal protein L29 [Candidatus Moranbacteria bacterium]